ncbi:MAG: lytic transglycosylase domain-containing protein [SAR324 cluster bacterium]|nr:lytic transglycosylase domain-containing protein [SAR324 cluster bacterium]
MKPFKKSAIFFVLVLIHFPVWGKIEYEKMIIEQSNSRAMDFNLLLAIAHAESNFRPKVVSFRGAVGLCQITIPVAKDRLGYSHKDRSKDAALHKRLLNPAENIKIALLHLAWIDKHLNKRFKGTDRFRMIVAIYNAGYRNFINKTGRLPRLGEGTKPMEKWKVKERDGYISKVSKSYMRFVNKYGHSKFSLLK